MLFTGTYEHTIDAKGRLAIPSDVRDQLDRQLLKQREIIRGQIQQAISQGKDFGLKGFGNEPFGGKISGGKTSGGKDKQIGWRDIERELLSEARENIGLYVCIGAGPTLCIYTEEGFEKRAQQLDDSELSAETVLEYEQMLFPLARRLELDKQGRIRLPEQLLSIADPGREVVITGLKDHMEIHNREKWNKHMQKMLEKRSELLQNPRQVIRAKSSSK